MAKADLLSTYISNINAAVKAGNATEHTHRPALKALVEAIAKADGMEVTATNEPKQEACGAPDYVITANSIPLGHIEAKDVGKDLNTVENTDQLKRYLDGLPNLVLTDYLEFRWYMFGEHRMTAKLDSTTSDGADEVANLISEFLKTKIKTIKSPSDLAHRMGGLARLARDAVRAAFRGEGRGGALHDQLKGFRQVLIDDLSEDQFADMYAQTICYGLFAARCNHKKGKPFTRYQAAHELPKTNPFLREIFSHVAGPELDERVTWIVDDLAELLDRTDIESILKDFGRHTRRDDPVVHFYETFLAEYDPKMREARGVYYTPEPVVSYLVKSVDEILKRDFKIEDGLADSSTIKLSKPLSSGKKEAHRVTILDPATGTGTFLRDVIARIHDVVTDKGKNKGMWSGYVSRHLLPRIFGFELLMAPYAVCHMKLGLQLADTGYDFKANERLHVYLTNSLQEAHELTDLPLFTQHLASEAREAGEAKQDHPVMVVIGNPPYSGHSANKGEWMHKLMRGEDTITNTKTENYFEVDGQKITDKGGQKWINDDYVKFIRFAQWRIEQTGHGILAFITNHGYLDNPTFRGMRQSLMNTFNDIYVLNLHGNSNKKEKAPDGTADKNVFDIQQGVSLGIFVKIKGKKSKKPASVHHADMWGSRDGVAWIGDKQLPMGGKYDWLYNHDVKNTTWTKLKPETPGYLFIRQDAKLKNEYETGTSLRSIFAPYGDPAPGMVTTHDQFAISWSEDEATTKVEKFLKTNTENEARSLFRLCSQDQWKYLRAKTELAGGEWRKQTTQICYRPFDIRWTVYNKNVAVHRRERVNEHIKGHEQIVLNTCRQTGTNIWHHVLAANIIADDNFISNKSKERGYSFPLYLYPKEEKIDLFDKVDDATGAPDGRVPNLATEFIYDVAHGAGLTPIMDGRGDLETTVGPEDIFQYIYAILHSPTYRNRYGEFLKIDFPRIPILLNGDLFKTLCCLGQELTELHLMKATGKHKVGFPVEGADLVEKPKYTEPKGKQPGRVWINEKQYFEDVTENVWNFHVGGYQVCAKWLKDRKGRTLEFDDIQHYQRIVAAIGRTIELMTDVDTAIENHGGWPMK